MRKLLIGAFTVSLGLMACRDLPTSEQQRAGSRESLYASAEEEIYGRVYKNGVLASGSTYSVTLTPLDIATAARLAADYDSTMALQSSRSWSFGWADPADGGLCGALSAWPDISARHTEVHGGSGPETHCVRAGRYQLTLLENGVAIRSIPIDYAEAQPSSVPDSTSAGLYPLLIENADYGQVSGYGLVDVEADFDLDGGSYTEYAALDIDVGGSQAYTKRFKNDSNPVAADTAVFRFSGQRSSTSWTGAGGESGYLARLHYRTGGVPRASNFYATKADASGEVALARVYRYSDHRGSGDTVSAITAGLEIRNASENIVGLGTPNVTRQLTATPTTTSSSILNLNGAVFESTIMSVGTDQTLDASIAESGSSRTYSWQFGSGGSWIQASGPLYEFGGFSTAGSKQVTLRVDNNSTSTTNYYRRNVTVTDTVVSVTGEQSILVKTTYQYTASNTAQWFQRLNPSTVWDEMSIGDSIINWVWPAGEYTVDMRTQTWANNELLRARLPITVCTVSQSCGMNLMRTSSVTTDSETNLFGAGPVLSWGNSNSPSGVQYYQLNGAHGAQTPFRSKEWLAMSSGSEISKLMDGSVTWTRGTGNKAEVVYNFVVHAPGNEALAFGLALDPDMGESAADDVTGYDSASGMVYVSDASGATGYMLLEGASNAVATVTQYGAKRFAPLTARSLWSEQRTPGVRLLAGATDAQFIVSGAPQQGTHSYKFVVLRAIDVSSLIKLARAR